MWSEEKLKVKAKTGLLKCKTLEHIFLNHCHYVQDIVFRSLLILLGHSPPATRPAQTPFEINGSYTKIPWAFEDAGLDPRFNQQNSISTAWLFCLSPSCCSPPRHPHPHPPKCALEGPRSLWNRRMCEAQVVSAKCWKQLPPSWAASARAFHPCKH